LPPKKADIPPACLRRFRLPIPVRVLMDGNRPTVVNTDRPGLSGGRVQDCAGPWRTSGEWWKTCPEQGASGLEALRGRAGWNRDEWDVVLGDGGRYRIFEDRDSGRWFMEAVVD
jgi:protein ImuB